MQTCCRPVNITTKQVSVKWLLYPLPSTGMYSPDNAEITRFSKPLTRQGADFFIVVRSLPYYLKTRPPYEYPFVNPGNFIYRRLVPRLLCLFGGKHHSYITYHHYHSDFAAHYNWQKTKLVIPRRATFVLNGWR